MLSNAKALADKNPGYSVYDTSGNLVYQPETAKDIIVGTTVKVKPGAKTYDGGGLASFVYTRDHVVQQLKENRAVITFNGAVVAAMKKPDLIRV
ncbi:MAG: hypothetical protein ACK5LX_10150 [Oscillospiraceae bacterium]